MASNEIGDRLRKARRDKNITQVKLAKMVGLSSHATISDYERGKTGKRRPDIQLLVKICSALDISIDYLFLGKETKKKKK